MAPPEGLEPPTLTLEPSCSIQLSYGGKAWGDRAGSNRQPPVPQTGALPIELRSPCLAPSEGIGHRYLSADKFRDPASLPSELRLSSPQGRQLQLLRNCLAPSEGLEPPIRAPKARVISISPRRHLMQCDGTPRGTRTPDLELRKLALYPAELWAQYYYLLIGSAKGNRTPVCRMKTCCPNH